MKKLTLKTFVFLLVLSLIISTVAYLCIWFFLPRTGKTRSQQTLVSETEKLIATLQLTPKAESEYLFTDFIRKTGADISLLDGQNNHVSPFTFCYTVGHTVDGEQYPFRFPDTLEEYVLVVKHNNFYSDEIKASILNSIPFIAAVTLILSFIGAHVFSKSTVAPIIRISKIADRMANLDFSWYCPDMRNDEIGKLSGSINEMSDKLRMTLEELNQRNSVLTDEIAFEKECERRRMLFFSGVSHELKTPIAVVIGQLEGMQAGIGVYKDREKYLARSAQILHSLSSLIKEVLAVSYLDISDGTESTEVCLSGMIRSLATEYSEYAGDNSISVSVDICDNITVYGDNEFFEKALTNIIENAVFYTPENGSIRIRLANENAARLIIENSPAHIGEEHLPHLFEAFYRAAPSVEHGSGLGLYITRMILEKYNIEYKLENTSDAVRFTLIFNNYTQKTH